MLPTYSRCIGVNFRMNGFMQKFVIVDLYLFTSQVGVLYTTYLVFSTKCFSNANIRHHSISLKDWAVVNKMLVSNVQCVIINNVLYHPIEIFFARIIRGPKIIVILFIYISCFTKAATLRVTKYQTSFINVLPISKKTGYPKTLRFRSLIK